MLGSLLRRSQCASLIGFSKGPELAVEVYKGSSMMEVNAVVVCVCFAMSTATSEVKLKLERCFPRSWRLLRPGCNQVPCDVQLCQAS